MRLSSSLALLLALSSCGAAVGPPDARDDAGGADAGVDAAAPLSSGEAALLGDWLQGVMVGPRSAAIVQLGFRADRTAGARVTVTVSNCGLAQLATSERTWRINEAGVLVFSAARCQVQSTPGCVPDPI